MNIEIIPPTGMNGDPNIITGHPGMEEENPIMGRTIEDLTIGKTGTDPLMKNANPEVYHMNIETKGNRHKITEITENQTIIGLEREAPHKIIEMKIEEAHHKVTTDQTNVVQSPPRITMPPWQIEKRKIDPVDPTPHPMENKNHIDLF